MSLYEHIHLYFLIFQYNSELFCVGGVVVTIRLDE